MAQLNPLLPCSVSVIGAEIRVVCPFVSDDDARVHVPLGKVGSVIGVDDIGDACISFANDLRGDPVGSIWIYRQNHWKLKVTKPGLSAGVKVTVTEPFVSQDDLRVGFRKRDSGTVIQIDPSGDACIHFPTRFADGFDKFWVSVIDFARLSWDDGVQHEMLDESSDALVAALAALEELVRASVVDEPRLNVGSVVQPIVPLISDDDARVQVEQGISGTVVSMDEDGDACVNFPELCAGSDGLWIFYHNLWKVKLTSGVVCVGSVVEVLDYFESVDNARIQFEKLDCGVVAQIDTAGDACIEFPSLRNEDGIDQFWIAKEDFDKLWVKDDGFPAAAAATVSTLRRTITSARSQANGSGSPGRSPSAIRHLSASPWKSPDKAWNCRLASHRSVDVDSSASDLPRHTHRALAAQVKANGELQVKLERLEADLQANVHEVERLRTALESGNTLRQPISARSAAVRYPYQHVPPLSC